MAVRQKGRDLERQALDVLYAVQDVAERLRQRRRMLHGPLSGPRHAAVREEILRDLDRLSNLVELAEDSLRPEFREETHTAILSTLHDLRDRNQGLGIGLAFEKIQELRTRAEETAASEIHPLGRSVRLKTEFLRLVAYLRSLATELSPDLNQDLQTSVRSINAVIERDREAPWLRSLEERADAGGDAALVSFIEPASVDFPVTRPSDGGEAGDGPAADPTPGDDGASRQIG